MVKLIGKHLTLLAGLAAAGLLPQARAQSPIDLGAASHFAVVAGGGITITGSVDSTAIVGDIGAFPTTTITGLENVALTGTDQGGNGFTQAAVTSIATAYSTAAGLSATTTYTPIVDIGGLTLTPGVYKDPTSIAVTGTLTLNGQGNSNSVWVFQAGSTLTTATNSQIVLENGAQASNVFWQVGSSATLLGSSSNFSGTILAYASISLGSDMTVNGSLFAESGAVTLNADSIMTPVPEPATTPMLVAACVALLVGARELRRHLAGRKRSNLPA
jgi:hypothetical protein